MREDKFTISLKRDGKLYILDVAQDTKETISCKGCAFEGGPYEKRCPRNEYGTCPCTLSPYGIWKEVKE